MNDLLFQSSSTITTFDVIIRILLSFAAGFAIGIERGRHRQVLSIRPYTLITIGSTLVMLVSIYISQEFGTEKNYDPGRIAAQVVSGIGFLGAGAIIRMGVNVKGLTTAAAIWVASAIGLAIGAGFYFAALVGVIAILIVLIFVDAIEKIFFIESLYKNLTVRYSGLEDRKEDVLATLKKYQLRVLTTNVKKDFEKGNTTLKLQVNIAAKADTEAICNQISEIFNDGTILYIDFNNME
ncbi:MAG: MgtC/SapB family protein [Bacteroidales bacterium]|nr:MgtC/SapB family protein [Bacteroidales bacterium]